MVAAAKAMFKNEFDEEYSWICRLWLRSGGSFLDTRGDLIAVHCDDADSRDQIIDDLGEGQEFKIHCTVERDPEYEDGYIVLIERGFLRKGKAA